MKQLWAVAVNDLKVEFADRSTWFSFLILPLIFTVVIGVATRGLGGDPSADPRALAALVDEDGGPLATAFTAALAQSKAVRFETAAESRALSMLKGKEVLAVIVRGQGPKGVLLECGMLLGFAVVFFALGVWRFKYE